MRFETSAAEEDAVQRGVDPMIGGRRRNMSARLILGTAIVMLAVENRHAGSLDARSGS
jgi:hypothetical protein